MVRPVKRVGSTAEKVITTAERIVGTAKKVVITARTKARRCGGVLGAAETG
jgi:hypothetical protein